MAEETRTWLYPTIILCTSGFLRAFNPSEPYLTPYLMGPRKNFTGSECVNQIFPVWSYSYLGFLVPVFLLTDFLKYKPVVVFEGLCYIGCWILLLFGEGVLQMQIMQVIFGMATACEIGYYSYIYSIVPENRYQQVTSYTRAAVLFGYFPGAILAQLLVSFANIDYFYLNVIALVNICISFLVSLFLPMPTNTLFFFKKEQTKQQQKDLLRHKEETDVEVSRSLPVETGVDGVALPATVQNPKQRLWKTVCLTLLNNAKSAYSNLELLRWSVWWALSTCGWMLVVNYIQNFWETIYSSMDHKGQVYNGAVDALATVSGALVAFSVSFIKLDWSVAGEFVLAVFSLFKCGLLLTMYFTKNIWVSYAAYIVYIALYNFVITIASFQLAVGLNTEGVALIFGINTFLAVGLNMALTVIFIDDVGLGMDAKALFVVCSVYFGVLALIYTTRAIYSVVTSQPRNNKTRQTEEQTDEE